MSELGIGVIGTGFMGLTYSSALETQVNGAKLIGVAGGSRAGQLAEEFSVPAASSVEDLINRSDVDAVVVATPDQNRVEITQAAASAGKHILVEKPMAPTVAECDAMIDACKAGGVHLGVVKTERFRKLTRKVKELIDTGEIGELRMMRTLSAFPIDVTRQLFDERQWMYDSNSGGLFMGMASHNTDFFRWVSGRNATNVFAQVQTYSDIAAPAQSVMAHITFEDGLMGQMWISSEFPPPSFPSSEVRFQLVGSEAMLDFDNFDFLDLGKGEDWKRVFTPETFDYLKEPKSPIRLAPHAGVLQGFVDAVREDRAPEIGGAEGRAAVEICEACLVSAKTGQAVKLPL